MLRYFQKSLKAKPKLSFSIERKNFLNVLPKKMFRDLVSNRKVNLLMLQNEHFSALNNFALLLFKKNIFLITNVRFMPEGD